MSGVLAVLQLCMLSLLFLLAAAAVDVKSVADEEKEPGTMVDTSVTKYMTPVLVARGDKSYESHVSNIEIVHFVPTVANVTDSVRSVAFAIQISRKSCKAIRLCFGNKTSLAQHLELLKKVEKSATPRQDLKKLLFALMEYGKYEADACKGMTALEWEFPKPWKWNNMSQAKGYIHYSALHQGIFLRRTVPSSYRTKTTGISNVEVVILHNDHKEQNFGLEIRHGPILYGTPIEETTPAYTTFYETFDLWSKSKNLYFILAQNANECGARISVHRSMTGFLTRESIINFRPGALYRNRKGINVWAIPLGFVVGTCVGSFGAATLLCKRTKYFYQRWNAQMKKTYGKFATGDATTMMTTVGGDATTVTKSTIVSPSMVASQMDNTSVVSTVNQ